MNIYINSQSFHVKIIIGLVALIGLSMVLSIVFARQQAAADKALRSVFWAPKTNSVPVSDLPQIANIDWSESQAIIDKAGQKKIILTWPDGNYSLTVDEIKSFVQSVATGQQQAVAIDNDKLNTFVAKIAKKIDKAVVNKEVTSDGEVVKEGKNGQKLNQDLAKQDLAIAILAGVQSQNITLAVNDITFKERTVNKPFTPGLYDGKYIEVNLSVQQMYLFEGNNLVAQHPVSTGKSSTPTPQGTFSINNKDPVAYSAKHHLYMPHWMAFIGSSYGIHGLPYAGNWIEGLNHLGIPVSHGCIRLSWVDAETVYNWVDIGTIVYIHT